MNKFFKVFVLVLGLCLLICGVAMAEGNSNGDSVVPLYGKELKRMESTCTSNGYVIWAYPWDLDNSTRVDLPLAEHSAVWKVAEYSDCLKQGKVELRCECCNTPMHKDKEGAYVTAAAPDTEPLEKGNHNTKNNPDNYEIPATCKTKGVKHEFCLTCGTELITEFEDENAHVFGTDQPVQKETCTEPGRYARVCMLCGYSQSAPNHPALGHFISPEEAKANFWNYTEQIRETYHRDATCQAKGETKYELVCTRCNKPIADMTVIIEKLPHTLDTVTIVITQWADCLNKGLANGYCTVCERYVTQELAKLPHKLVKHYIAPDENCKVDEKHNAIGGPTCVLGADYYNTCEKCTYFIDKDGNATIFKWQAAIYHEAALDHDWSNWQTSIEASKDSLGLKIRFCHRCEWINRQSFTTEPTCTEGQTIYDFIYEDDGTTLVSKEVIVKDPVPHTEVVAPAVEATYDHPGKTSGSYCKDCGVIIKEQQVIPQKTYATIEYTLSDVKFDGSAITGKVVHVENTGKVDTLFVRIVVFMADGTYMITVAPVADDMTFEVGASGDFDFAGLVVTGTMKSVAPGSYEIYGSMGIEL